MLLGLLDVVGLDKGYQGLWLMSVKVELRVDSPSWSA